MKLLPLLPESDPKSAYDEDGKWGNYWCGCPGCGWIGRRLDGSTAVLEYVGDLFPRRGCPQCKARQIQFLDLNEGQRVFMDEHERLRRIFSKSLS